MRRTRSCGLGRRARASQDSSPSARRWPRCSRSTSGTTGFAMATCSRSPPRARSRAVLRRRSGPGSTACCSARGFFKQARPEALLLLSLLALRLLFYARWSSWDGREWGPRYLLPLLPVLLVPLICLPAQRWLRIGAVALAALGVGVELLGQLVPYETIVWPTTAPLVVSALRLHDASGSTCLCSWFVDAAASTAMDFDIRFAPLTRQVTLLFRGTVDPAWSNAWPLRGLLLGLAAAIAILLWRTARRSWYPQAESNRRSGLERAVS